MPAITDATRYEPVRTRFTLMPARRATSRFAPTKSMWRPSGVQELM